MTTLEKSKFQAKTPSEISLNASPTSSKLATTFEETYKASYSHGFESIYALETIDIKSVRTIQSYVPVKAEHSPKKRINRLPAQLELSLGEAFSNSIVPFIKGEPVQVLNLSKHAEKCLVDNGKHTLGDLIGQDLNQWISIRGMGQGHIEDIKLKLNQYLSDKDCDKADKVDFLSWIKTLVGAQDKKKAYVLLEKFGLNEMLSLSPSESVEVRKLTLEKKLEWRQELLSTLVTDERKNKVFSEMSMVFNVFIKPWINRRGGFATTEELSERFDRISEDSLTCQKAIDLIQNCFLITRNFLQLFLIEIDQNIYSSHDKHASEFDLIIAKAKSYFYKPSIFYSLNELLTLLEKEFAKLWKGFPENYIKKVLTLSSIFHISKSRNGTVLIHKVKS